MNEDVVLNAALKNALESDAVLPDEALRRIITAAEAEGFARRTTVKLRWGVCLTAASVLLVVAISVVFSKRTRDNGFSEIIQLLARADGVELKVDGGKSAEELLLAWQEAPLDYIGM